MEPVDYLSGLRRRWWVIVALVVLGLIVGWFLRSVFVGKSGPRRYQASAIILGSSDPKTTNLATLSALTTVGPVPGRAAQQLHYGGDPLELAKNISTEPNQDTGMMSVDAEAATPADAKRLANVFADQLVKYSVEENTRRSVAQGQWLRDQINHLAAQIRQLDAKIGSATAAEGSLLSAQRDAKVQAYGAFVSQYQQVVGGSFEPSSLQVIQKAGPGTPVTAVQGLFGSVTLVSRLIVAGVLGLVLGLVLVLVLERVDRRIRTREAAERSLGLPVLAEISDARAPIVRRNGRISSAEPLPLLGALLEEGTARLIGDFGNGNGRRRSQTILVTSPTSAEGKSSVVARLATTYASEGKRVLVVSSDFRGDGIDRQFGVSNEHGLSDALLVQGEERSLEQYVVSTKVPNVWVLPSGRPPMAGGSALASDRMRRIMDEARSEVDVVLVDAAPILVNGDAPHLLRDIDSVLLVARTGKTTTDEAKRTADILARLDAPVAGVALTGAKG